MKRIALLILVVINIGLITGCRKGFYLDNTTGGNMPPVVEYTTASLSGRVVDLNGKPVSNALISTRFSTTTSDVNGLFNLTNTKLDKNASFILVSKPGYFNGSKTFEIADNSKNYAEITLIPKTESGTFSASSGGNITVANGGTVSFQPNAVKDASTNAAYTGTVSVAAYYINPSNSNVTQIMPGELRGIDTLNNETGLQSFSMMAVELSGSAGQKLQLASGKTAAITFPIPSSLQASAPATIPLWYFDETTGLWKQEGVATKQGNNYSGSVAHFSYWNCDAGIPLVKFTANIEDNSGNPLSGIRVGFAFKSDSAYYRYDYTNATGGIQGKIPANKSLELAIYSRCGDLLYTQNVTTNNSDIDLGIIKVNAALIPVTFSGTVKDCSGNNVTGGTVTVLLDGIYTTGNINNGNFSLTVNRCNAAAATASIVAIDTVKNVEDVISVQNITNANINNIALTPCTQSTEQYVTYTLNNTTYSFINPADSLSYNIYSKNFTIWATKRTGTANSFYINVSDTTIGSAITSSVSINQPTGTFQSKQTDAFTTTLTEFGQVKMGYVAGSFTGNVYGDTTNTGSATKYAIQGTFRIKRTN